MYDYHPSEFFQHRGCCEHVSRSCGHGSGCYPCCESRCKSRCDSRGCCGQYCDSRSSPPFMCSCSAFNCSNGGQFAMDQQQQQQQQQQVAMQQQQQQQGPPCGGDRPGYVRCPNLGMSGCVAANHFLKNRMMGMQPQPTGISLQSINSPQRFWPQLISALPCQPICPIKDGGFPCMPGTPSVIGSSMARATCCMNQMLGE